MKDPIKWAIAAVKNLGWKRAFTICNTIGRPMIGDDKSIPNPHGYFYKMARGWIMKNVPEKSMLYSEKTTL